MPIMRRMPSHSTVQFILSPSHAARCTRHGVASQTVPPTIECAIPTRKKFRPQVSMTVLSSDGWSFGCPDRVFDSTGHDAVSLGAMTALDPNVNADADARTAQRNQAAGRVCARTAHHQTADAHATDRPDGPSRGNRHCAAISAQADR
jgi:hypothetical protein